MCEYDKVVFMVIHGNKGSNLSWSLATSGIGKTVVHNFGVKIEDDTGFVEEIKSLYDEIKFDYVMVDDEVLRDGLIKAGIEKDTIWIMKNDEAVRKCCIHNVYWNISHGKQLEIEDVYVRKVIFDSIDNEWAMSEKLITLSKLGCDDEVICIIDKMVDVYRGLQLYISEIKETKII